MEKLSRFLALEGNIRVLAVQTLLSQIGLGMFYVIWQPYLLSTGMNLTQLGLVQTIINLSTGIGLFLWGYVSDSYGRKPVIITTIICRIIAILILLYSDAFWAFIGFGALMGLTAMFNMANPARSAMITESVDSPRRATAMSTVITIAQGTSTLVAILGGYIAIKMGYTPIFYLMVIGDTIGALICYRYLKETLQPNKDSENISITERLRHSFAPEQQLRRFYIAYIIMGFSYTVAYSLLYGALTEKFGFTTVQLGYLTMAFNLMWAVDSLPLGKIVDRIGRKKGILLSNIMAIITPIGFLFADRIELFMIFYSISALDIGFWIPSYTSYITETVKQEKRSTVFGKLDAYGKMSGIPGAWIAGLLYENYGFYAPQYVQIVAVFLVVLMLSGLKEPEKSITLTIPLKRST
jgi:DHA1 family multidrug resistance protein-like MFS transporter